MGRIPIRARLTAAFAVAMALVLTLVGLFIYVRVRSGLDATINSGLRSRADDVAALVTQADSGLAQGASPTVVDPGESFAQVLRRNGTVFDAGPGASKPALEASQIASLRAPMTFDSRQVTGVEGGVRLLATPVRAQGMRLVVVVGSPLSERDEALSGISNAFLVGSPLAIVLASGIGYLLASAGLAPVEALRRRADRITLKRGGERLPLPDSNDEIRRLAETLNAMLARLEESFARERAFVADASHELRSPLAVLKAELEVTLRQNGYDERTGAALRNAAEEVDQLARLAEDLLVIARSENGALDIKLERTNVRDVLAAARNRVRERVAGEGRTVELDAPRGLDAQLDPLRVRQAVGNLIDNALRYGAGPIVLEARGDGDEVVISVNDSGAGFPTEFVGHAFDRFSRADRSRGRGGAGLGLAIVQAIARAHDGEASIEPQAHGARVALRLPRTGLRSQPPAVIAMSSAPPTVGSQ